MGKGGSNNLPCYQKRTKPCLVNSHQVLATGLNLCSQTPPIYLDQPNTEMLYEPLNAHSPLPYVFTFHLSWTVNLELDPETAQSAVASVVTERMALGCMTQFFILNSRGQTWYNHYL